MTIEKRATVVSTSVAMLLVVIKMSVGILSGSVAILASAIDSMLDLTVSMFNYFAINNAEKDPDDAFNYGRNKMEPLAAVIEGTIISFSALFILYEAIDKIAHPREMDFIGLGIVVMLISIVITFFLVIFLNKVAKKTGNMVIKADSLHYKTDIFSNGVVLLALGLVSFTGENIIDPILGILISIYMIYSALPIIKEGMLMLLDVALNQEDIEKIKAIIDNDKTVTTYHDLRTRISGSHIFISVHIVFNVSISLYDAHLVSDKIEDKIRKLFADKKVHILMHMDPYDDSEINSVEDAY
ncbi:MAG: cation diffusion facilitator family transporter [Sulfurimonas sp.]|jgi:cation diffusion facilitator family transporter|uniref:cation diffusion facilitator family transporter n=1 Tax=Sulfurimonas sp. TaxID=2022749 RepID=UPI00262F1CDE|nr:cation diffusion facilitator family transporter [Sulfurimonas sp.]MDD3475972.1 cation diffusion facilitator family transporter [Sulfurimonas sp.]HUH42844.1 cation diffusion facilitator family transporter [Sulfurimonas sp.]